jgi:Rhodopirellula transposase DDE domain
MENAPEFGGDVVFRQNSSPGWSQPVSRQQVADLRLAAAQMTGAKRRAFQAEMAEPYCAGNARQAERMFGWGRETIEVGLAERRTGITCLGAQSVFSGRQRWEDRQPQAAAALRALAEAHAQQDPTVRTPLASTRLTATAAVAALRAQGFAPEQVPAPRTMASVLNRLGFGLRKVLKAQPQQQIAQTDASFENIKKRHPSQSGRHRQTLEHRL